MTYIKQVIYNSLTRRSSKGVNLHVPSHEHSHKILSLFEQQSRSFSAAKAKKKKNKGADSKLDEGSKKDPEIQMLIRCIDTPQPPKPKLTDEQKERHYNAGKNYVIGKFNEHNALNHDLACKIKLKQHAIKLLPKDEGTTWKEDALKIEVTRESFPPLWRNIPTEFPPIPGFNPEEFSGDGQ